MTISQREAHRLKQRVVELEKQERDRRYAWATEWPGGVNIVTALFEKDAKVPVAIRTARMLGHAVVAVCDQEGSIRFMALPLAEPQP